MAGEPAARLGLEGQTRTGPTGADGVTRRIPHDPGETDNLADQPAFATQDATPDPTVEFIALDVIGYHFLVPTIAIANAGNGVAIISWSPNTPGFALQESTNLLSAAWHNSASSTNNPATITNTTTIKFYRVVHP